MTELSEPLSVENPTLIKRKPPVKMTARILAKTQDGHLLLRTLDKSSNIDVLNPQEKSFLTSLRASVKGHGRNFDWSPSVLTRLRQIVSVICWDIIES